MGWSWAGYRLVFRSGGRQSLGMTFADLKNDFVFHRIFGHHPDLLRGLLNDLLERQGDRLIEEVDLLPLGQAPVVVGARLSVLDVRCRDRAGTTYVVPVQLIHVPGFIKKVVLDACKADMARRRTSDGSTALSDVVVLSICDFALWPDAEQDAQGLPRVPMLSRWCMAERAAGQSEPLAVQHVFLELPKLPDRPPETGAELWAWLFVHAPELAELPEDLPPGPHRQVVELANEATFTKAELDACWRLVSKGSLTL